MEKVYDERKRATVIGKRSRTLLSYGEGKRVWELDFVRGLLIIVVTFDHTLLFGYYWGLLTFPGAVGEFFERVVFCGYLESDFRSAVAPLGLWLFSFLSGVSGALTRSCERRAAGATLITSLFMAVYLFLHFIVPARITGYLIFNVLAVIATGTVVDLIFEKTKTPVSVRFFLSVIAVAVGITFFYKHYIGGGVSVNNAYLSLLVYNSNGYSLSPNNFEPLFPHLGWFMLGGVLGRYFYSSRKSCTGTDAPRVVLPICLAGKYSLTVYLFGAVAVLLPLIALDRLFLLL